MKTPIQAGALALALFFAACAPKAKVTTEGFTVGPFNHKVSGPDLNGTWASGCERDDWSSGFVMFNITFKDQTISRKETKFQDPKCTVQLSTLDRRGLYRYVAAYSAGIFELEYRINMPNGFYTTGENVSRSQNRLWITDRRVGNGSIPSIALDLQVPSRGGL